MPVKVDDQLLNELGAVVESHYMKRLPTDQKPIVQSYLDDILSTGGTIPGDVYQKHYVSELGRLADGTPNTGLSLALNGIKKSLDRAFDRSAGDDAAAAIKDVRGGYVAAKTIEPLANNTGDISAARLANLKNAPGDLGDLSPRLAVAMKGMPDSGTAQRSFMMDLLSKTPFSNLTPLNLLGLTGVPWATANAMTRGPTRSLHFLQNNLVTPEIQRFLMAERGCPQEPPPQVSWDNSNRSE